MCMYMYTHTYVLKGDPLEASASQALGATADLKDLSLPRMPAWRVVGMLFIREGGGGGGVLILSCVANPHYNGRHLCKLRYGRCVRTHVLVCQGAKAVQIRCATTSTQRQYTRTQRSTGTTRHEFHRTRSSLIATPPFCVKSNNLGWARIDHQAYMWTKGHGKQLLSWRLACSMVHLYLAPPSLLRPSAITAAEMRGWPESIGKL